jgi:hypothetical protein
VKDIFDPQENIDAGTRYLKELLQKYNNDVALTLAAYNAGPDRVQQYGRVPPYVETIKYVRRVKNNYEKSKASAPPKGALAPATAATPVPAKTAPPPGSVAVPPAPATTASSPRTPQSPQAQPQ